MRNVALVEFHNGPMVCGLIKLHTELNGRQWSICCQYPCSGCRYSARVQAALMYKHGLLTSFAFPHAELGPDEGGR